MGLRQHKNRFRVENNDINKDSWLLTYSDMITLLMAFFVIIVSVSKVDPRLWEQIKKGLRSEILDEETQTPLAEIKHDLDSLLENEINQNLVSIDFDENGIRMQFASSAFYKPGSANVQQNAKDIIDKVGQALKKINYYKFSVDVEGHTDDVPIHTTQFPSNWELSVSRATNIVKYLINMGIDSKRLKAAGYADTKPVVPNEDSTGAPIPQNRAKNRRILIFIR